ncbi:MAG: hypothetical protein MJB12_13910, partial [Firmicutes bacterium]|nr:hypothetical protein [Bacillota bacterium]
MKKTVSIILTAVMVLGLLPAGLLWNEGPKAYASTGEVVLVNDHFDDGMIPEGWSEKLETSTTWEPIGTTGQVSVADVEGNNCLQLELVDAKNQPHVRRTFTTAADDVIVSFAIRSSRNAVNIPILIKDSNENVISRMYFGQNKRIFLVTGFDESGSPILEDALDTGLAKNTVYHIGFVINTKNNTQSTIIIHGNQTYTLKDKPLLAPADSVGALQVHQYYMYNNNGFIYLDDIRVEESAVNKMSLRLAVQNAQKVLADARVGTEIGFYPQTAVDAFQAEIDLA